MTPVAKKNNKPTVFNATILVSSWSELCPYHENLHREHFGDGGFCFSELAVQSWTYEDLDTHDNVADCLLIITILKHGKS